ncbi:MAG: 50S ribosomal protein L28 [Bacilli bacterium]|nr:50S ribosomal protein L28 [Bacilli bacterium]
MAMNITTRVGNVKNKRSHALNATKKRQNLNLQVYRLEDGTKVRLSTKEIKTLRKNEKTA